MTFWEIIGRIADTLTVVGVGICLFLCVLRAVGVYIGRKLEILPRKTADSATLEELVRAETQGDEEYYKAVTRYAMFYPPQNRKDLWWCKFNFVYRLPQQIAKILHGISWFLRFWKDMF